MNLSVSTLIHRHLPLFEALKKIASLGIKCVELCVDEHHSDPGKWKIPPEEMALRIRKTGIAVNSIHIPLIASQDQSSVFQLRKNSLEKSASIIDLAVILSAGYVVQHVALDASADSNSNSLLNHAIPELNQVAAYAQKRHIKIALENVPNKNGDITLGDDPLEIMGAVEVLDSPAVGMCFDVSHCVASGHNPLFILQKLNLEKLISLHVSDNQFDLQKDLHLPLGHGQIQWSAIFNWLNDKGFNGSIVVEVAGDNEKGKNLIDSLAYLEAQSHLFTNFPKLETARD